MITTQSKSRNAAIPPDRTAWSFSTSRSHSSSPYGQAQTGPVNQQPPRASWLLSAMDCLTADISLCTSPPAADSPRDFTRSSRRKPKKLCYLTPVASHSITDHNQRTRNLARKETITPRRVVLELRGDHSQDTKENQETPELKTHGCKGDLKGTFFSQIIQSQASIFLGRFCPPNMPGGKKNTHIHK